MKTARLLSMTQNKTIPWDIKSLSAAPKTFDDSGRGTENVKAIFYEGLPWKGNQEYSE